MKFHGLRKVGPLFPYTSHTTSSLVVWEVNVGSRHGWLGIVGIILDSAYPKNSPVSLQFFFGENCWGEAEVKDWSQVRLKVAQGNGASFRMVEFGFRMVEFGSTYPTQDASQSWLTWRFYVEIFRSKICVMSSWWRAIASCYWGVDPRYRYHKESPKETRATHHLKLVWKETP